MLISEHVVIIFICSINPIFPLGFPNIFPFWVELLIQNNIPYLIKLIKSLGRERQVPWFLTEGKSLLLYSSYLPLGVSQLVGHLLHQLHANKFFGTIHHRAINSNQEVAPGRSVWTSANDRTYLILFE
jgi:hypothetical protein